jgi:hypothetical protein
MTSRLQRLTREVVQDQGFAVKLSDRPLSANRAVG